MSAPCTFPIPRLAWPELAELLARPWPREGALVDLRWWTAEGRIPGRRVLAARWGWSDGETRELLADRSAWLDRTLPPPTRNPRPARKPASIRGGETRRWRRSTDRPTHLHMTSRWKDILAMSRSHPEYKACLQKGWDREDLDQEVAARIAAKQELDGSAYDGERAGMGKYLWTSTRSILLHLLEQRGTLKETRISTGVSTVRDGERVWVDAAEVAVADAWDPVGELDERRRSQPAPVAPRRGG